MTVFEKATTALANTRTRFKLGLFGDGRESLYLPGAAIAVLTATLGASWVERNVMQGASRFFGEPGSDVDPYRLQSRVCSLAEMVYNLSTVPGFPHILRKLESSESRETYESAYAELEAARLLKSCRITFRIREPSGVARQDYDFDVDIDGIALPCEAKCKIEGTTLSENAIYNPIHAVGKQVPRGSSYWVIIKLPLGWDAIPGNPATLDVAIARAFGNHRRLQAVVYHWETQTIRGYHSCVWGYATHAATRQEADSEYPGLVARLRAIHDLHRQDWESLHHLLGIA
jgi:hypothetical protein